MEVAKMAVYDFGKDGLFVDGTQMVPGSIGNQAGKKWYVSRNVTASGNGKSWAKAFKTIGEAITQVNADATAAVTPDIGRNAIIYVGEGWYSEIGMTLSASDVTIVSCAPGAFANTVLYGSATAGGWDAGAVVPALTITGANNSIIGMSFVNSASGLYDCVQVGALAGAEYGTKLLGCQFPRDVADAYISAIQVYDLEGTHIKGCLFSQSASTRGVNILSDGVVNPVNVIVEDSIFTGIPTGVNQVAGHNTIVRRNFFQDATDDRDDTSDTPIVCAATSMQTYLNYAQGVNAADVATGNGITLEVENHGDDA
jgi:hypothetical protein